MLTCSVALPHALPSGCLAANSQVEEQLQQESVLLGAMVWMVVGDKSLPYTDGYQIYPNDDPNSEWAKQKEMCDAVKALKDKLATS